MRMVRIRLACGCCPIARYEGKLDYLTLPEETRTAIVARAAREHVCRAKKAPAAAPPVMSSHPQKP